MLPYSNTENKFNKLMKPHIDPDFPPPIPPLEQCRRALRKTRHLPERERLAAIDKLLGNFGVEAIRGAWQNGYWCDVVACYSNTGDTYALTVIHVRGAYKGASGRFHIGTMGDWVEKNQRKFGIQ